MLKVKWLVSSIDKTQNQVYRRLGSLTAGVDGPAGHCCYPVQASLLIYFLCPRVSVCGGGASGRGWPAKFGWTSASTLVSREPRQESRFDDLLTLCEMEARSPRPRLSRSGADWLRRPSPGPCIFRLSLLSSGVPLPEIRACWSRISSWP